MNDIEILDKLRKMLFLTQQANECGLSNNDFKEDIQILSGAIELIENLLKERQADKDKIKELEAVNAMQEYRRIKQTRKNRTKRYERTRQICS